MSWFAAAPGGDRPVPVLTRDPVADRIGSVVVAAITRTVRGIVSELELTAIDDGVPTDCVVNFHNIHTTSNGAFRRHVVKLEPPRLAGPANACATPPGVRRRSSSFSGVYEDPVCGRNRSAPGRSWPQRLFGSSHRPWSLTLVGDPVPVRVDRPGLGAPTGAAYDIAEADRSRPANKKRQV